MAIRAPRVVALGLALLGLACGDAPTGGTEGAADETLVVSLHGVPRDHAGVVLRLSSAAQSIEPANASLEIGWAVDPTGETTVVVIGAVSEVSDLLFVTRRTTRATLRAEVIELADAEGALSLPSSVRATVRLRGALAVSP
jgi:hypothetical protein